MLCLETHGQSQQLLTIFFMCDSQQLMTIRFIVSFLPYVNRPLLTSPSLRCVHGCQVRQERCTASQRRGISSSASSRSTDFSTENRRSVRVWASECNASLVRPQCLCPVLAASQPRGSPLGTLPSVWPLPPSNATLFVTLKCHMVATFDRLLFGTKSSTTDVLESQGDLHIECARCLRHV